MQREDQAGYLNDPLQAKHVMSGGGLSRQCRHCDKPLVRVPQGAIICSGTCDQPVVDPEFTRQVQTGQE